MRALGRDLGLERGGKTAALHERAKRKRARLGDLGLAYSSKAAALRGSGYTRPPHPISLLDCGVTGFSRGETDSILRALSVFPWGEQCPVRRASGARVKPRRIEQTSSRRRSTH